MNYFLKNWLNVCKFDMFLGAAHLCIPEQYLKHMIEGDAIPPVHIIEKCKRIQELRLARNK
jgi:hypothetical protein